MQCMQAPNRCIDPLFFAFNHKIKGKEKIPVIIRLTTTLLGCKISIGACFSAPSAKTATISSVQHHSTVV